MANVQSLSRGFKTTAIESVFAPATGVTLVAGDLVSLVSEGVVNLATLADGEEKPVFMVLEGNDTFSGKQTGKVVVVSGHFETTVASYQTGSYTVNTALTANAGKFIPVSGTKKAIAEVLSFSLSQGLKVRFFA